MTRWFRVYDDLVDEPKVQCLEPSLFKVLINLWCLASVNDGALPPVDEIAFKLRMKPERVQLALTRLFAAGLLDNDERGARPHNWDERQFLSDASTPRVQRFRKRRRNVSPIVSETSPETEAEAETERKNPSQGSMNSTDEAPAREHPTNGRGE
jgi:hypothetical protein